MEKYEKKRKERRVALSPNGWYQLLSYLELNRPKEGFVEGGCVEEDHLFLSEWYQPLTVNAITLLFDRLRKRAGISEKPVSPSVLRDTFAVRYLQAGGTLEALRDLLGLANVAALKRYEHPSAQMSEQEPQKELALAHQSTPLPALSVSRRCWRRPSSATPKQHLRQDADRPESSAGKEPITDAEDDP